MDEFTIVDEFITVTSEESIEKPFLWLLHDTTTRFANGIVSSGVFKRQPNKSRRHDGPLTKKRSPKTVWYKVSFDGTDISIYPQVYAIEAFEDAIEAVEDKKRFMLPPESLIDDSFHMFLGEISRPKEDKPGKRLQLHLVFIRPTHKDYQFCKDHFKRKDCSTFQPFRFDTQTRQWMGITNAKLALPDAPSDAREYTVNVAIAGDVEWKGDPRCKRLADVSPGIPSIVKAPEYGRSMCISCLTGQQCSDGETCIHFHDYAITAAPVDARGPEAPTPAVVSAEVALEVWQGQLWQ